jgi:hypothetical protein
VGEQSELWCPSPKCPQASRHLRRTYRDRSRDSPFFYFTFMVVISFCKSHPHWNPVSRSSASVENCTTTQ